MKIPRILAVATVLGIVAFAAPALAQVPVIDAASLAKLVQQINMAQQRFNELVQQYDELKSTYQALSQDVNPNQWAQRLDTLGMQDPLPDTSLLPSMLDGISPPSELGGNLGSLAEQLYDQNKVYIPQGNDFAAKQIQQGAHSTADFEAAATQDLQSLQEREAELPKIQDQLNGASTIQQVAAIQARLEAEQNYVSAQQAQAQNLQLLAYEQTEQQKQAAAENNRKDIDQTISLLCNQEQSSGEEDAACQGQ